jgi:hypothetical protein
LFNNEFNKEYIRDPVNGYCNLIQREQFYRHELYQIRSEEEYYIIYQFYYVFNNDRIPRDKLEKNFQEYEKILFCKQWWKIFLMNLIDYIQD